MRRDTDRIAPQALPDAWRVIADDHSPGIRREGVSITLALIWRALRVPTPGTRFVTLSVAVLCVALPLAMLQFPAYQGLIQRFMYLFVFAWLWACFPAHTARPSFRRTVSGGR